MIHSQPSSRRTRLRCALARQEPGSIVKMAKWIPACAGMTIFLFSFSVNAQTPVTEKTANAYYASCTSQSDERLTPDAQAILCGCVSAKLMSSLTMEEIASMSEKPGPGRDVYDKMLINAYSPCLQIPIQDQISRMPDRQPHRTIRPQ